MDNTMRALDEYEVKQQMTPMMLPLHHRLVIQYQGCLCVMCLGVYRLC